jgi:hypothetical protein
MTHKIKNPIVTLLLCIVTCGVFSYITIYMMTEDIKEFTNDNSINPGLEILLCIITCNIYTVYWCYKYSKYIFDMQNRTGVEYPSDISIISLILPLFGLTLISLLLMQTELNKVWMKVS